MKNVRLVGMLLPALLFGCGSSDSGSAAPGAGAGGAAAGATGTGGSNNGGGGSGGKSSGGSSGTAGGSAGSSGTAGGSGGNSGTAGGSGGATSGGNGGTGGSSTGGGGSGGANGWPTNVPDPLKVPVASDVVVLKAHGVGVQIYTCTDTSMGAGGAGGAGGGGSAGAGGGSAGAGGGTPYQWVFKAPKADLFDDAMVKLGIHYAGPTWESTDGSTVVGMLSAKVASPTPGNIPWLLLTAKSNTGMGVLTKVTFIQRLDTKGGVAPADGCDATHVGMESQINYEASYYFYAPGP